MSSAKRNSFLEADDNSEDERSAYDSEAEDLQKGGRTPKRRKIRDRDNDDRSSDGEDDENWQTPATRFHDDAAPDTPNNPEATPSKPQAAKATTDKAAVKPMPLTSKNLVVSEAAVKKSGVVYLSRIPPMMKPQKLRSLLSPHGRLNRLFLAPEDPASHARRVRAGGNKKRSYTEGWVEFVSKRDAKRACELLNGQIIGGKKGSFYHDDIWNLVYLKGFKWHNLTEQITSENVERAGRMMAEIGKTKKEDKEFLRNVEQAKMLDGMEAKRNAKKRQREDIADPREGERGSKDPRGEGKAPRTFNQIPLAKRKGETEGQSEQVKRVLSKIF
jgi:ESF2/ABP1 family protein